MRWVQTAYNLQKTKPFEYRLKQLRKLYCAISDHSDAIIEACKLDLGKPAFETYLSGINWCKNDIVFVTKHLASWMKEEKPSDISLMNTVMKPRIRKEPLGTILIIGAYNFPVQLSLGPLIGAIAAGCTCVLKPSKLPSATAMVLKRIIESSLDPEAYLLSTERSRSRRPF